MAILKIVIHLFALLMTVSGRLSASRWKEQPKTDSYITHREIPTDQNQSAAISSQADKAGKSKPICSLLPSVDKSAPQGATLQLFGSCTQYFPTFFDNGGIMSYGYCGLYTNFTRIPSSKLGALRYELDAATAGGNYMQLLYTMSLFVDYPYQIMLSGATIVPAGLGPYLMTNTTFSINNVVIAQGLANQKLDDCKISSYKKIVYTVDEINSPDLVNFTFF
jgi:hypothetical protein